MSGRRARKAPRREGTTPLLLQAEQVLFEGGLVSPAHPRTPGVAYPMSGGSFGALIAAVVPRLTRADALGTGRRGSDAEHVVVHHAHSPWVQALDIARWRSPIVSHD